MRTNTVALSLILLILPNLASAALINKYEDIQAYQGTVKLGYYWNGLDRFRNTTDAEATVINSGRFFDFGLTTLDERSQLEWLNLDVNNGRSLCDVTSDLQNSLSANCNGNDELDIVDAAQGWRVATKGDVQSLFDNFFGTYAHAELRSVGTQGPMWTTTTLTREMQKTFHGVFSGGQLIENPVVSDNPDVSHHLNGWALTENSSGVLQGSTVGFYNSNGDQSVFSKKHTVYESSSTNNRSVGSTWMVRDFESESQIVLSSQATAVNAPATFGLIAIGMLGMVLRRR